MYIKNSNGPNTDPCGTPLLGWISSSSMLRLMSLYVSIIIFKVSFRGLLILVSIICWRRFLSSVSKALEMSSARKCLSPFFYAMYIIFIFAVFVLNPFLAPCCFGN